MDNNERLFDMQEINVDTAQVIIKKLAPGLTVKTLTRLDKGMSTSNYLVNASDNRRYLIRIYPKVNDHCRLEAAMYEHVRFFMDVPEVLCCDDSGSEIQNSYLILEYIEGLTLGEYITEKKKLPGKIVRAISSALALLHRREYPHMAKLDASLEPCEQLDEFSVQMNALLHSHAGRHLSAQLLGRLEDFLSDNTKILAELSAENVLVHGDVNFSNIIITPEEKPYFIDFEYAFAAPRYCDIGKFFRTRTPEIERRISPSVISAFYDGYSAGAPGALARQWYAYGKIADIQALLYLINKPQPPGGWVSDIEAEIAKTLRLLAPAKRIDSE